MYHHLRELTNLWCTPTRNQSRFKTRKDWDQRREYSPELVEGSTWRMTGVPVAWGWAAAPPSEVIEEVESCLLLRCCCWRGSARVREGRTRRRKRGEKSTKFDGKSASLSEDRSGEERAHLLRLQSWGVLWGQSCGFEVKSDADEGKEWKLENRQGRACCESAAKKLGGRGKKRERGRSSRWEGCILTSRLSWRGCRRIYI